MKVIIQIPCLNEGDTLPVALAELPRKLPGIDSVEWLVVDDGSSDRTAEVAAAWGVEHIVRHPSNLGLARAFTTGLEKALQLGADIIVNTDADNQYSGADIAKLVQPIVDGRAEVVVGERPIMDIDHFSRIKKLLQRLGSWSVRVASGTAVPDAPSGFRAMSRKAAAQLNVFNGYTYTLETIIQAGIRGITITSVPVRVNGDLRPSRLVKSIPTYVRRSLFTIMRIFVVYKPFRVFGTLGIMLGAAAMLIGGRFLWYWFQGAGDGHIQSLILASILAGAGFQSLLVAFLADTIAANRMMLEDIRARQRMELGKEARRTGQEREAA